MKEIFPVAYLELKTNPFILCGIWDPCCVVNEFKKRNIVFLVNSNDDFMINIRCTRKLLLFERFYRCDVKSDFKIWDTPVMNQCITELPTIARVTLIRIRVITGIYLIQVTTGKYRACHLVEWKPYFHTVWLLSLVYICPLPRAFVGTYGSSYSESALCKSKQHLQDFGEIIHSFYIRDCLCC